MPGDPLPEIGGANPHVLPDPHNGEPALPGQLVPTALRNGEQLRHFGDGQELFPRDLPLAVFCRLQEEPGRQGALDGRELGEQRRDALRRDPRDPGRVGEEGGKIAWSRVRVHQLPPFSSVSQARSRFPGCRAVSP